MLSPTQGFTYNKFEKPSDWPDIKKTFDYQIENGKLLGANDYIELKGPIDYTLDNDTTIVDNVITSGSIEYSAFPTDWLNKSMEAVYSFRVKNIGPTGRVIATYPYNTMQNGLYLASGIALYCFFGGSYDFDVVTNTNYKIKVIKTGLENKIYRSVNGEPFTLISTQNLTGVTYSPSINNLYAIPDQIEWDLNETYIKIDDSLWFGKKYRRTEESNGVVTKSTIPVPEGLKIGNYTVPYNGMYDIISQTLVEDCSFYPINKTDAHFLPVDNNKLVGPIDYTTVGSPTIVDNIVSNFSSDNYLEIDSFTFSSDSKAEFYFRFKTKAELSDATSPILGITNIWTPALIKVQGNNLLAFEVYPGYSNIAANTWYRTKVTLNGDAVSVILYNDDGVVINQNTGTDSTILGNTYLLLLGNSYGVNTNTIAELDLKNSYIKTNGVLWFGRETWQPSIYDTNCMIELVGHTSDYSSYNNYGFTPTVSNGGTYNVWIDNQKVKENIASETATQLSWSDLALTTGYAVTTPSSLKAHVVKIEPSVDTNTLTGNLVTRVSSSGTEQQGRLHQIIGTRDVFNLNRVSSSDNSVTSPVLKSLDSFTGELNSNTLVYSFYDTNLEHIPTIAMNGASSMYDGLGAFQQTKIKYVALKGTNTLKEASKFFDTLTLEKIDSENTLEFNTGDFGNNKKLKMLPKGTFVNSNYSDFLTQDSNLLPTNLDLSSNNTIIKLDVYGTSDYRIDGLKSLLVSNEAPFTGTSPQINVSYTGLDRDALVNLFNSMPYNVGYTIVGSPTITDGVASNFSDNDYFTISTTFDLSKAWEIVINYNYGTVTPSTMGVLLGGRGHYFQWQILTNGQISYAMDDKDGNTKYGFVEGLTTKENSFFKMMYDPTNKEITCYKGTNGLTWTQEGWANTVDLTGCSCTFDIGSGVNSYGTGFPIVGSVNFNNTRIKINNILWFNGQVAITKSINITECTGISDLTNDDKAIVTNKGWTITE